MNDLPRTASSHSEFLNRTVEASVRIGVLVLLATWCFHIVKPFVTPVVWGIIIAVAVHPGYLRLQTFLGGRRRLAATLFTLLSLVVLLAPTMMLSDTLIGGVQVLAGHLRDGTVDIPPPPERIGGWPLIGRPLENFWSLASVNLEGALQQIGPQLKALSGWLVTMAAGASYGLLQFVFAIIIAGVLLTHAAAGSGVAHAIAARLAGGRGGEFADLADATVRSVARGILGVALIQSILAGIGFLAAGVPGAGLWAMLCLLLSVVQIGPALVLIPVTVYVFATAPVVTAVLFTIWCIFVGLIDNLLKPLLLGRGVNVPMVVIFIGAIGGFLSRGIIGLFVGSIVLVLGYTLLLVWLQEEPPTPAADQRLPTP